MFTSHKQISPPSLVLKLKISEVSQKWIPKAVELKRIPTHKKCKCKKFCSQTRLVGEIYSSDVIMHRGYCNKCYRVWEKHEFTLKVTFSSFINLACLVKVADYWPLSFVPFYSLTLLTSTSSSVRENRKKRTCPIFSWPHGWWLTRMYCS